MEDLKLKELLMVYPDTREHALAENIRAVPLAVACGMARWTGAGVIAPADSGYAGLDSIERT